MVTNPPTMVTSAVGLIHRSELIVQDFVVDGPGELGVMLNHLVGEFDVDLVTPHGDTMASSNFKNTPGARYGAGAGFVGPTNAWMIQRPVLGTWKALIRATSIPSESTAVGWGIIVFCSSTLSLEGQAIPSTVAKGGTVKLLATIRRSGRPELGVQEVTAFAHSDSSTDRIALNDTGTPPDSTAGDGIYSGQYFPTIPGMYTVGILAKKSRAGAIEWSRIGGADFSVRRGSSSFQSGLNHIRESIEDIDGNGLVDSLVISVDLNIDGAGRYELLGILTDKEGYPHLVRTKGSLDSGPVTWRLVFRGSGFYRRKVNGPYKLTRLALVEVNGPYDLEEICAERAGAFSTSARQYMSFEH